MSGYITDSRRATCLCDAGAPDYVATVAVDSDGCEHLVLAERYSIGDEHVRYDATCRDVPHEQTGPLPLEYVRRLMISIRSAGVHRCGRPTKTTGRPCRIEVTPPGEACGLHRGRAVSGVLDSAPVDDADRNQ